MFKIMVALFVGFVVLGASRERVLNSKKEKKKDE